MSIEKLADGVYRSICPNPACPRKGTPWNSSKSPRACPTCHCRRLDGRKDGRFAQDRGPKAFKWVEMIEKVFPCGHHLPLQESRGVNVCPQCFGHAVQDLDSKEARRFSCQTPGCPLEAKPYLLPKGKRTRTCTACGNTFGRTEAEKVEIGYTLAHFRLKRFKSCGHTVTAQEAKGFSGCPLCQAQGAESSTAPAKPPKYRTEKTGRNTTSKIDLPKPKKIHPLDEPDQSDMNHRAFGLWKDRKDIGDGLEYQERIRSEWPD